jgi:hypothetical protein
MYLIHPSHAPGPYRDVEEEEEEEEEEELR